MLSFLKIILSFPKILEDSFIKITFYKMFRILKNSCFSEMFKTQKEIASKTFRYFLNVPLKNQKIKNILLL